MCTCPCLEYPPDEALPDPFTLHGVEKGHTPSCFGEQGCFRYTLQCRVGENPRLGRGQLGRSAGPLADWGHA